MKKYFKIWLILTGIASQIAFQSRFGAVVFIIGKILRFLFFLLFLLLLSSKTNAIAGYSLWQIILFFITFNLVDTLAQFFLREVYRFRSYVVSGDFDYILTKPVSPLFRSLFGGSDILDLSIILLSIAFIIFSAGKIESISLLNVVLYIIFVLNAFLIALAFHIFVLAIGVLTTEVDNTIMLYRDITQMGRLPVDIYREPLQGILTFVIPVGIMMTFPAKALMGLLSLSSILTSVFIGILFVILSLWFWRFSLKHYSSASS
ncbi:MAG: ABC-2 family transporter protein [Candidatus Levybacteria bacterium]|nr:ABC-2 family transporter protein [Candidatus Levybacteria bacterium]